MSTRVTMKGIAQQAGVSVMTVSLALRGSPRISLATREKVRRIAEELGFRPDPALQALVAYRQIHARPGFAGSIAYLNNTPHPSVVRRVEVHRNFFNGAKRRGAELGYKVEEFWLARPGTSLSRSTEILLARGVQGVLVGPMATPHVRLPIDWSRLAAVRLSFSLETPRLHAVRANHFLGAAICFRELLALGYRRIGLVISNDQDERTELRYSGAYLAWQNRLPKRLPRLPILHQPTVSEASFLSWLKQHQPDAIIAAAANVRRYLEGANLRLPDDVGLAYPYTASGEDAGVVACADGRQEAVGAAAVEFLAGMLMRNEIGLPAVPCNLAIDPEWKPGKTVRRRGPTIPLAMAD